MSLIYGLVSGILFGVLLQRAEVLRYDRQVGALRLLDMTIFKFMLSAIMVAAVGIYALKDMGLVSLSLKATALGPQIVGGTLFLSLCVVYRPAGSSPLSVSHFRNAFMVTGAA